MLFQPYASGACFLFAATAEAAHLVFPAGWRRLGFGVAQQDQFVHGCGFSRRAFWFVVKMINAAA
jgi:hypothetical protein